MLKRLAYIINNIIRHPKAHWPEIASVLLVIVVLALGLYLLIRSLQERLKESKDRDVPLSKKVVFDDSTAVSTKVANWPFYVIMAILAAVLIIGTGSYITQSSTCAACHQIKPYYKSWKHSSHKKVPCLKCHQTPGIRGYLTMPFRVMSNFSIRTSYYKRFRPITAELINNNSCRTCHPKIRDKITSSSIKISHKGIDKNYFPCVSCHQAIGHKSSQKSSAVLSKNKCLICHNNQVAPFTCSICHTKDIGWRSNQLQDYTIVTIREEVCGSCHSTPRCSSCHQPKKPAPPSEKK